MNNKQNAVSLSRAPLVIISVVVFLIWLALWSVATLMEYAPHTSIWFPPAGLTFALLLVLTWRAIPGIFLAILVTGGLANVLYGSQQSFLDTLLSSACFSISHIGVYGLTALLLRFVLVNVAKRLTQKVLWFLLLSAVGSFAAAYSGISALVMSELIAAEDMQNLLLPWWIGDLAGVVILSPMVLAVMSSNHSEFKELLNLQGERTPLVDLQSVLLKILIAIVLLASTMALTFWLEHIAIAFSIFLIAVPIIWVVREDGSTATGVMLLTLSFFTAILIDVFAMMEYAALYQFALIFMAAVTWLSLATAKEKQLTGA
ncbi:MAG: putative integral membrane sensor domain [Idiomarinaceae bacterium HL-53]|nr:MAG: putative integral membrane sensor domain [Idiomarinaceae bacterium HL-53]CUS48501.1 Integral membrane sensor domain MASE1 [Idiomarinaceae bacterium HL-53]